MVARIPGARRALFGRRGGAAEPTAAPTSPLAAISQDGVNITLDTTYQVGQHVDDTYFVIADGSGEVVFSAGEVDAGETVATYFGGVMVDPADMTKQGFDSRTGPDAWYDAAVNEALPLTVDVSDGNPKTVWFYRGFDLADPDFESRTWGYAYVQVTVYAASNAPLANPIKPPGLYVAGGKPMLTTADINYNAVTPVAIPVGASEPDWDTKGYLKRPAVYWGPNYSATFITPALWQEQYNGNQAPLTNAMIMGAISESADRNELINRLVRDGMEVHASIALNNRAYTPNGGHGMGWQALRFWAGIFTDNSDYLSDPGWVNPSGSLYVPFFYEDALYLGVADGTYTYGRPIYGATDTAGYPTPPYSQNHIAADPNGVREAHWIADYSGMAQGGGASTITLAAGQADDIAAGDRIYNVTADELGEVASWDNGTKVATMAAAWSTQPQAADEYEVYKGGTYQTIFSYGIMGAMIAAVVAGVEDQLYQPVAVAYARRWFADNGLLSPAQYGAAPAESLRKFGASQWVEDFYTEHLGDGNWPAQASVATTLSNPTGTKSGSNSGSGTVVLDMPFGTLYWYVSTSVTAPSAADLKAGTGAADSGSQTTITRKPSESTGAFSGLSAETTYYIHYLHRNLAGIDSAIVTSASFTTDAVSEVPYTLEQGASVTGTQGGSVFTFLDRTTAIDPTATINQFGLKVATGGDITCMIVLKDGGGLYDVVHSEVLTFSGAGGGDVFEYQSFSSPPTLDGSSTYYPACHIDAASTAVVSTNNNLLRSYYGAGGPAMTGNDNTMDEDQATAFIMAVKGVTPA
jgi:hypothetical protein